MVKKREFQVYEITFHTHSVTLAHWPALRSVRVYAPRAGWSLPAPAPRLNATSEIRDIISASEISVHRATRALTSARPAFAPA
jgi:hypothetical protein